MRDEKMDDGKIVFLINCTVTNHRDQLKNNLNDFERNVGVIKYIS